MSFNGSEKVHLVTVHDVKYVVRGAATVQRAINVVVRHIAKNKSEGHRIGAMDVLSMATKGIIPEIIDVTESEQTESEQTESEQTESEQTESEQAEHEHVEHEQTHHEHDVPEHSEPKQTEHEHVEHEQTQHAEDPFSKPAW